MIKAKEMLETFRKLSDEEVHDLMLRALDKHLEHANEHSASMPSLFVEEEDMMRQLLGLEDETGDEQ